MSRAPHVITVFRNTGPIAEDKDFARSVRLQVILPALGGSQNVRLDFTGVRLATQSFVHACVSEAVRKYGHEALRRLEFHGCVASVRTVVETVISYSLDFATEDVVRPLPSRDVPQADDLPSIRAVVEAVHQGATDILSVEEQTGFSQRHSTYRVAAAQALGLLEADRPLRLTESGTALWKSERGSVTERALLKERIQHSLVFKHAAPDLFEDPPPTRDAIATRLTKVAALNVTTAKRRAAALLSWRRQLIDGQLDLPLGAQPPKNGLQPAAPGAEVRRRG